MSPSMHRNQRVAPVSSGYRAGRLRLRWLVAGLTLAGVLAFVALAVADRRAAPLALAGAVFVAAKGLGWLIVLRRNRARLRRHGLRW